MWLEKVEMSVLKVLTGVYKRTRLFVQLWLDETAKVQSQTQSWMCRCMVRNVCSRSICFLYPNISSTKKRKIDGHLSRAHGSSKRSSRARKDFRRYLKTMECSRFTESPSESIQHIFHENPRSARRDEPTCQLSSPCLISN